MQIGRVALETAGAHLAEGDTGAVVGVNVGRNLEDKAGELVLLGTHCALFCLSGARRGRYTHEAVEQLLNAEVVERAAEEDRCRVGLKIEAVGAFRDLGHRRVDAFNHLQVVAQAEGIVIANGLLQLGRINVHFDALLQALLVGLKERETPLVDVVDALEALSLVDGPGEGAHLDVKLLLQLVQEIEGILALAVHLVDEDDDGRLAHAAHFHELARLGLNAFGAVDHNDARVHRRECAEGVLGEVLMARCIEDVDLIGLRSPFGGVVELHDRSGHTDAALLFNLHPVGGGGLLDFVALDGTGHLNLTAEKQQLLGECRLARIGMRDDGKGASAFYFRIHNFLLKVRACA